MILVKNVDSVLGNERLGESQKSLRWDAENLRDGDGSEASHVDGFGLLKSLEHPRIKVEHGAVLSPGGVVGNRLGAVFPVVIVRLVTDGACQRLVNRSRR